MALNDIFRCTDYQRLPSGEQIQNVYFYERVGAVGTASDLLAWFASEFADVVKDVQSNELVHTLYKVENLGDVADFDEFSEAGDVGAAAFPVRNEWDAYAFTLRPSTRAVRPGSKRIGGVFESDAKYTNGVVTAADLLTALHALRLKMAAIADAALDTYTPVIIKRVLDGTTYRLPETDLELVSVPVATVLLNTKITHQVSRGNSR
jgi:hypothetical protein